MRCNVASDETQHQPASADSAHALGRDPYVTNSGQASYTFASLPTGNAASAYATVLYACVRDVYGASNCTTTLATVGTSPELEPMQPGAYPLGAGASLPCTSAAPLRTVEEEATCFHMQMCGARIQSYAGTHKGTCSSALDVHTGRSMASQPHGKKRSRPARC